MMLDATAANRRMWPNKNAPLTIYMDRETKLKIPPTIIADNRFCPFRDDVFNCVIYDPPYYVDRRGEDTTWMFYNPGLKPRKNVKGSPPSHYGLYKSKTELLSNLHRAAKEFLRISKRLCFQWGEGHWSLWQVLPLFRPWKQIYHRDWRSKGHKRRAKTHWVTFINPRFAVPPKQ